MKEKKTPTEPYSPDNIMKYHTALSVVDNMEKEGFLSAPDKRKIYTVIARKYGIDSGSIFAAKHLIYPPFRVIYSVPELDTKEDNR